MSWPRDRRHHARMLPELAGWQATALLRPGHDVMLVDIGPGGALMRSRHRMSPGVRAELHLFGESRCRMRGLLLRCRVAGLTPLCFEGAVRFDDLLALGGGRSAIPAG